MGESHLVPFDPEEDVYDGHEPLSRLLEPRLLQERVQEAEAPVPLPEPVLPAWEEQERHFLTHLPKAAWCEACTAGKSKGTPHRSLTGVP